ncbi:MAG TPA: DUF4142 domain-containing protein [Parafilimonas sp.]|nr:DUF4142 domain-containing protein [Parafilimonas sp.]
MKRIVFVSIIIPAVIALSCNDANNTDSKKIADKENDQKEDSGTLNKKIDDDANFVTEARSGVLMEVELGTYAQKNAASEEVKQFGERMVKDHSKDRDELKMLATNKNISIPDVPGEKFQKHIDDLEKETGSEFDKDYMSFMVSDHHDDIDEFEKEAKNGKDSDIVAFANKGLPVLKEHLSMAQSIHNKLQ